MVQVNRLASYFAESIKALDAASNAWSDELVDGALQTITGSLRLGRPLLICGNGGSAADAMHITGELLGRFFLERQAWVQWSQAFLLREQPPGPRFWGAPV